MFDVTHQTNEEKRPLGIAAAVDQNMEIFTPFRVFMPSQQQWVFDWIFRSCIPVLMGPHILERTQLVLTDGDKQMYGAFDNVRKRFIPMPSMVFACFIWSTRDSSASSASSEDRTRPE